MRGVGIVIALAVAGGLVSPVARAADPPGAPPPGWTAPAWKRKPTPEDLLAVWPKEALRLGKGGRATIDCKVSIQGTLFDCRVFDETPAGAGFGGAAIAMTPQLLFKPAQQDGKPVASSVRLPVKFEMPEGTEPATSFGSHPVVDAAMAWPQAPTYSEVTAAYPSKARAAGVGGYVGLHCSLTRAGELSRCETLKEEPRGYGFAAAARQLSKRFRAFPTTAGGKSVEGAIVQVPFAFDPNMLQGGSPVIGKPHWARTPTAETLIAAFPKNDTGAGTVRVRLACRVEQGGAVSDCKVEREEPPGRGYGASALAMTGEFRLATWTMEGLPAVGGTVVIPIRYEFAAPDEPKK